MRRLLVILMLSACGPDGFEPGGDLDALRFDPPPSYREMWARAEACSGRRGNFERIRWWVVPGVETFEYSTEQPYADGLWDSDGDITLAGGVLSHPMVVRHEMLHALGFGVDHPAVPFQDPCHATWNSWDRTEAFLSLPPSLAEYAPTRRDRRRYKANRDRAPRNPVTPSIPAPETYMGMIECFVRYQRWPGTCVCSALQPGAWNVSAG